MLPAVAALLRLHMSYRGTARHFLLLLPFVLLSPSAVAQEQLGSPEIRAFERRVTDLRAATERAGGNVGTLQALAMDATQLDADLDSCVRKNEKRALDLQAQL